MTDAKVDLECLSADARDNVVVSGLNFMRSITEAFGSEKGLAVWDTISSSIGDDLKGAIFFKLITGDFDSRITIIRSNAKGYGQFVSYIKEVRNLTGWGLKEAKDFCDETEAGTTKSMPIPAGKKSQALTELSKYGVVAA